MMQIEKLDNKLRIKGNIKSIADYTKIKNNIDEMMMSKKRILIELIDSISVTSSIIGYFSKIVNVNGIILELYVSDDRLFDLLDDLGVLKVFNVKRIKYDN